MSTVYLVSTETDKAGATHTTHTEHWCWDAELFIHTRREEYLKLGRTCAVITQEEYRAHKWPKKERSKKSRSK